MLVRLASDLHLEFGRDNYEKMIPSTSSDIDTVLVVPGDIHVGSKACDDFLPRMGDRFCHVIYVLGNHEFYGYDLAEVADLVREKLDSFSNISLLDDSSVVLHGVRFIGSTLWTDVNNRNPIDIQLVRRAMSDYYYIKNNGSGLKVEDTIDRHEKSVRFIESSLEDKFDGPNVIATHHGPSYKSAHPRYLGNSSEPLNVAFYSNLEYLMNFYNIDYWFHGHTHSTVEYEVNGCKVRMNPRGYGDVAENRNYDPFFQVEV